MSDMKDNGSGGGARPIPFGEPHDQFLELCALSTADALSAEEKEGLERHLAGCRDCRETLEQYRTLIAAGIPAAAVNGKFGESPESGPDWSLEEAETRLLARLDDEPTPKGGGFPALGPGPSYGLDASEKIPPRMDSVWRQLWLQSAAALLLVSALGYGAWLAGIDQGMKSEHLAEKSAAPAATLPQAGAAGDHKALARAETEVRDDRARLASLRIALNRQIARISGLEVRNRQAETDLSGARENQASLELARDNLARQLAATETNLDQARQQLSDVSADNAGDAVKVIALRRQVAELNRSLGDRQQDLARAQVLLDHDRDIRELMGSRDLYIAEVYDVAKNGETKKPFGRVFYTKGKSLIFYAYDLDQQPGIRDTSTFQAWASRGRNREDAVSLGIFYQDNGAKKRWILKAENSKALSGIDSVFVTVEPHGGSSHPSGKPLLYAYLHIGPNHP